VHHCMYLWWTSDVLYRMLLRWAPNVHQQMLQKWVPNRFQCAGVACRSNKLALQMAGCLFNHPVGNVEKN
jgi:hypothetical protein